MTEVVSPTACGHRGFTQISILGLPVHMVQIPEVIRLMVDWLVSERNRLHWIVVADMHGVFEAQKNVEFRRLLQTADLTVPDGISLVWVARRKGFRLKHRVSGTDLMRAFFGRAQHSGWKSYFYGDTDRTLRHLVPNLHREFPGLSIAGSYSPPFRPLTPAEDRAVIRRINKAKPDVLWVSLGLPKQEQWIADHRDQLEVPLVLGVGAALKFLAGTVRRAPIWIGDCGLEWLWRLAHEPRRLWRRVLIEGPQFVGHVAVELAGFRKSS